MTPAAPPHRFTVEEYLRLDAAAEQKHEFYDGAILAKQPVTYRHSLITTNLIGAIGNGLEGSPCHMLDGNMRVAIARAARYVYPDCLILCDRPAFDPRDPEQTTIINPRVIIEVLSDDTEAYPPRPKEAV